MRESYDAGGVTIEGELRCRGSDDAGGLTIQGSNNTRE